MATLPILALSLTIVALPQSNGSAAAGGRSAPATALASPAAAAPVIDGRNDDAAWQTAPSMGDFRQFEPQPDSPPSLRTEFQVTYDDDNLYVYVRAFDPHPDSIMHALTRRDVRGPSDQIIVIIDSYNDRRSGFEFHVNPDGVKRDYSIFNDNEKNESWNGVWHVATAQDSLGWAAEFRIPLSQLRYAETDDRVFGFGVWREIERYKERVSWPLFSTTRNGLVSQLGTLEGLTGIRSPRRLELTPYVVTKNIQRALESGGFERRQRLTGGGDLKYGITPNITLDATVNPDFGQVEADPAQVNLTAFETFFPERRPFFVEGTGFYRFALNCYIVVDCNTNEGLFYSRRIGRAPSLLGLHGDAATPTATPIAAAAKLTGRTARGLSYGLLDALTPQVTGRADRTVEPASNYAVLRAQQDWRAGDLGIGLIATAVNRGLDDWTRPELHSGAYVAGANFRNRFGDGQYELAGSFIASHVTGSAEAIARTQRNAIHYYQQPEDDHALDATRTSLSGSAAQLKLGKYGGGFTRFETSLVRQSIGFEVNDLGFLRRADLQDWSTWAALTFRNPRRLYRWLQINGNHWERWTTSGLRLDNAVNFNAHIGLHNNWDFHAGATLGQLGRTFCDRCTRGGPALRQSRGLYPWFGFNADSRRFLVPSLWVNLRYSDEGRSEGWWLGPGVSLRFSTQLQVRVGAGLSHDENDTQWYGNFTDDAATTHYAFAHLDQRTLSANLRVNYTATPDLTFEFYGEPFVSTGTYSRIREVSATPGAADYDARFRPYVPPPGSATEFRYSQLRTNAVLRWEYSPGSTLFLVWAHGRQDYANDWSGGAWGGYRDLFELHPDNTFLIKIAHWLNR